MSVPHIAAIHDLSCYGRCSLTTALPILSAMGCQCCPLPTAVLSAHTGFPGSTFLDTTGEMERIADHWAQLELDFQAIYSGFLGSADQIDVVDRFLRRFHRAGTLLVMDPVMGDHGQPYRTCTPALCRGIGTLVRQADIITPNLTEAALLLDLPYEEARRADPAELVRRLSLEGRRSVVLTGYSAAPDQIGALCFDRTDGQIRAAQSLCEPKSYPGTGDLFASVLTGALVHGAPLVRAAQTAADFVGACIERSIRAGTTEQEGVEFEPLLGLLAKQTSE